MDVKVNNEQMALNLKHFLINFKSKANMYEVDTPPQPPKRSLLVSQIHFDETWRHTVAYFGYDM